MQLIITILKTYQINTRSIEKFYSIMNNKRRK